MLEDDDVTLLEAELPGVLRLEVVECLAWWLTQLGGSRAWRVSVGRRHAWVEARAELKYFYRLKEWNILEIKKLKYFFSRFYIDILHFFLFILKRNFWKQQNFRLQQSYEIFLKFRHWIIFEIQRVKYFRSCCADLRGMVGGGACRGAARRYQVAARDVAETGDSQTGSVWGDCAPTQMEMKCLVRLSQSLYHERYQQKK